MGNKNSSIEASVCCLSADLSLFPDTLLFYFVFFCSKKRLFGS